MIDDTELRLESIENAIKCRIGTEGFENIIKNAREIYDFCKEKVAE